MIFSTAVGYFLYIRKFISLENQFLLSKERSVHNILKLERAHLRNTCSDWALWDDSWEFMQNGNPDYISNNLALDSLITLDVNLMSFIHYDGTIKWQMEADLNNKIRTQSPEFPLDYFPIESLSFNPLEIKDGIAQWNNRIMLIASHPIYKSDDTGNSLGFLLIARDLTPSIIGGLSDIAQVNFKLLNLEEAITLFTDAELTRLKKTGSLVKKTKKKLYSYIQTSTITAHSGLLYLELELPRTIMRIGWEGYIIYLTLTLSGLLLIGYATLQFIILNYSTPVKQLYQDVQHIREAGDLSYRLPIRSDDEFGQFCRNFNSLLQVIEVQRNELIQHNLSLHEQANTDALTGLFNKRFLESWLESNKQFKHKQKATVSFLMLDIDHFKQFNDRYGHMAGDICLRKVADLLTRIITRPTDFSIRYGGEEFILILTDTASRGAKIVADKILNEIVALGIENADSAVSPYLTISIGIACGCLESAPEAMNKLIQEADNALYESKKNGRHRYTLWEEKDRPV